MQNFDEVFGYGFSSCRLRGYFASGRHWTLACVLYVRWQVLTDLVYRTCMSFPTHSHISSTSIHFVGIVTVVINIWFTYPNLFIVCVHAKGVIVLAVIFFVSYIVRVVELYVEVR